MDKQKEIEGLKAKIQYEIMWLTRQEHTGLADHIIEVIKKSDLFTKSDVERKEIEAKKEILLSYFGMVTKAPELNPSNYNHDEVCQLNRDMIEIWGEMNYELNELETQLKQLKEK